MGDLKNLDWRGAQVVPATCCNTGLHRMLYTLSRKGWMTNCVREIDSFRCNNLLDIRFDTNRPWTTAIAEAQQLFLKDEGIALQGDFYTGHMSAMIASYLLSSCLCFVQVESTEGLQSYYATKQRGIMDFVKGSIIPADISKINGVYFQEQYTTSLDELIKAKFKVITLKQDADGLHLGKGTLYTNSSNCLIYPLYMVRSYKDILLGVLKNNVVRITCLPKETKGYKFITSLNGDVLCKWLKTRQMNQCTPIWQKVQDTYCEANLRLPNLHSRDSYLVVNLFHIKDIEIL